jgi:hypothetical protein
MQREAAGIEILAWEYWASEFWLGSSGPEMDWPEVERLRKKEIWPGYVLPGICCRILAARHLLQQAGIALTIKS